MAIEYDPPAGIDYGIRNDPPASAAQIPIQTYGSGPAIGYTSARDPETGDMIQSQFRYTPVNPQDELMRQAFIQSQQAFYPPPPQPQGPTPYWENPATYYPRQEQPDPVAQAKAATAAAYKYIAFRGYQQDLKEGKSAADAFAKWGPMLVQDVSFAPAMKALTPTPQPTWMPANAATGQPGAFTGRVTVPPNTATPRFVPANPVTGEPAHYEGGGRITQLSPQAAPRVDPLTISDYSAARKEFDAAIKASNNPDLSEDERTRASAAARVARARMENIRKGSGQAAAQSLTPEPIKAVKEIIRLTRDGKKAVFDAATKQFIRYAE